jgi:ElaB/YqjD/DUF883 family membrane-anchored ribosome-binding protein
MADRNDASPSTMTPSGGGSVVVEFLDAARSAAESLLHAQKRQIADRASGVAEALRSAAHPLHRSQNQIISRYVEQAAYQVEEFARNVQDRHWKELLADTEEFARRQPTLFVLGAVAAGFVIGRLLWTSAAGEQSSESRAAPSAATNPAVTAAVSSGSGTGELTRHAVGSSGGMENR